jgi:Ca2+-binding RTX toxin-like protein
MAIITGTDQPDILDGTPEDDQISGLAGNDELNGSFGSDRLDGGGGEDVADYTALYDGTSIPDAQEIAARFLVGANQFVKQDEQGNLLIDQLVDIETIRDSTRTNGTIDANDLPAGASIEADILLQNTLLVRQADGTQRTYKVENFNNLTGSAGNDVLIGDLFGGRLLGRDGDDRIRPPSGNGLVDGGNGTDTLEFGFLPVTVKLGNVALGTLDGDPPQLGFFGSTAISSGETRFTRMEILQATEGLENVLDSTAILGGGPRGATPSFSADLETGAVTAGGFQPVGEATFTVRNFKTVIGNSSANSIKGDRQDNILLGNEGGDELVGRDGNDLLVGGGNIGIGGFPGRDTLDGGNGNDVLIGSGRVVDSVVPFQQLDTLTGGNGRDKFVLGDRRGTAYLESFPGNDQGFATITDLGNRDVIELSFKNQYILELEPQKGFKLYAKVDTFGRTRDLIADVTATPGVIRRLNRSVDRNTNTLEFRVDSGETILGGTFQGAWVG